MARPRDHAKHVTAAVQDLIRAVTGLVESVGETARGKGSAAVAAGKRTVAKIEHSAEDLDAKARAKSAKLKKALKAYWSRMKGKAREERIAKILKGRGLKPRKSAKPKAPRGRPAASKARAKPKAAPPKAKRASSWTALTPEQRAARVAKMQAGRRKN